MSGKGPRRVDSSPRFLGLVCALVCISPIACSGVHPNEFGASSMSALVGGSLSPVERDAVVFIRANHEDGAFDDCTGTLLSPRVLITAKHCVTLVQSGEFVCTGAGTLRVDGHGAGLFGAKFDGERIEVFRGTAPVGAAAAHVIAIFATESSDACHDDVAAVVLDTPIQQDSYPPLRVARSTPIGETVRLVGYGTTEHGKLIERREIPDVRVVDVGRDDGVPNPNATTPPRSFVVGGATACFGDSGGPALSMTTGALTGVYSRITGDCFAAESRNTYMLASSFVDVFSRAFELAGEEPLLEPTSGGIASNPIGAAGAGGATVAETGAAMEISAGAGGTTGEKAEVGGAAASGASTGAKEMGGDGAILGSGGSSVPSSAGSGALVVEPSASSRHQALHCTLGQSRASTTPADAILWLLVALVGSFSHRRCGRRPSEDD